HRGRGRQADRLRGGDVDRAPGGADPRRHGLLEGDADRALLPRRQDHRDLRGHQRDPAAGQRPARDRAAPKQWPSPTSRSPPCALHRIIAPRPRSPCRLRGPSCIRTPTFMTTARKSLRNATPARKTARAASSKLPSGKAAAARLEPVLAALRERAPAARQAQAEAFARAFYRRMSAEELEQHSAQGWAALALDFFELVRARKPGTASVRIFNPSLERDGWESPHTVIQVANDDMPFLVDSGTMALAEQGIGVDVLGHPVVPVQRDQAGKPVALGADAGEGAGNESLMHLEVDRQTQAEMPAIEQAIHKVLGDVRAAVSDWEAMRSKMLEIADDLASRRMPVSAAGRSEAQEFLRWAADNHFTFLGYREYDVVEKGDSELLCPVQDSGLGLMRGKDKSKPRDLRTLAAHYMPQSGSVDALILTKTNARATVHRPGYMDYIGVLKFDEEGKPTAEQRFLGLYTSSAYSRRPWEIPLVRE